MRMRAKTTMRINFLVKAIMIVLFVLGAFVFFVDISKAAYWVSDPLACPTSTPGTTCQSPSTPDSRICGLSSGNVGRCWIDMTDIIPSSTANEAGETYQQVVNLSNQRKGGYILDCHAIESGSNETNPACDNGSAINPSNLWCNEDSSCYGQNRITTCTGGWASTTVNNFNCSSCKSGYYDCDTNDLICEVHDGDPCTTTEGLPGTKSGCNGTPGPGVGDFCVPNRSNFVTGITSTYLTSDALLSGVQLGDGDLIRFTHNGSATSSFVVFNSGQVAIGHKINISTTSVAFEVSSTERGILIPRLGGDFSGAVDGELYYDSVNKKFRYYSGTSWNDLGGGSGSNWTTTTLNTAGFYPDSISPSVLGIGSTGIDMWLQTSSTPRIYINESGDVGIGTTTPESKLSINTNYGFYAPYSKPALLIFDKNGTEGRAAIRLISAQNQTTYLDLSSSEDADEPYADLLLYASSSNAGGIFKIGSMAPYVDVWIYSSGTERMVVKDNGNIGIGTISPLATLSVNGDLQLLGSNRYLNFGNTTGSTGVGFRSVGGFIQVKHTSGDWFTIPSSTGGAGAASGAVGTSSINFVAVYDGDTSVTGTPLIYVDSSNSYVGINNTSPNNHLSVTGNANFTGNVGINSTTPGTSLVVIGTSTLQNVIPHGPYSGNVSSYSLGASTTRWNSVWAQTYNIGSSTWSITQTGTRFAIFDNAGGVGNERLTILNSNGYIGVGSSTPSNHLVVEGSGVQRLQVRSTDNAAAVKLSNGSANGREYGFSSENDGYAGFYDYASGSFRMAIDKTGNVGIGTTTPVEKFSVVGNISNLLTNQSGARQIATTTAGTSPRSVFVSGRFAYVLNYTASDNFRIIDITNPLVPTTTATMSLGTNPSSIYVAGRYAYVSNYNSNNISIIDVSNPSAPVQISTISVGNSAYSVYISGHYLYVTLGVTPGLNFKIYDISNPYNPVYLGVGSVNDGLSYPYSIYVSGRYAYTTNIPAIGGGNSISVVDISNPSSPVQIATTSVGSNPYSIYVSGRYAYVANQGSNSVSVVDISSSTVPSVVATVGVGSSPYSIYVSGRYAYVANSSNISVIDINNPRSPVVVATITAGTSPRSVFVSGRYAYTTNYSAGTISVLDISGTEVSSLLAHSAEAGNLQVQNDIIAQGVGQFGSLNVGYGGLLVGGPLSVSATSGYSYFGGKVGIGTTTINYALSVSGDLNISGNYRVNGTSIIGSGLQGYIPYYATDGNILTAGNLAYVSTTAGLLGIGTTNPTTLLTVNGTSTVKNILPYTTLTYDLGASTSRWNALWVDNLNIGTGTWSLKQNGTRLGFYTQANGGGIETISVLNNGNVGIGTTSPQASLDVYGTNTSIRISGPSQTDSPSLLFMRGSNSTFGGDNYSDWEIKNSGGDLSYTTRRNSISTTSLVMHNSGYIGIGTSTPQSFLEVVGSSRVTNGSFTAQNSPVTINGSWLYINQYDNIATSGIRLAKNSGGTKYWITVNSGLHIGGDGSEAPASGALNILSSGNVGIGTADPQSLFNVNGGTGAGPWTIFEGGGSINENTALRLYDRGYGASNINILEFAHNTSTGNTPVGIARIKSTNPDIYSTTGGKLILETAYNNARSWNSNQLVLENDGDVGIGTSTPLSQLHIQDGGLLVNGTSGGTPISGTGTRMMWIPNKAAFRAGAVYGSQWDNANIGMYSVAFNRWNIAKADNSFVTGISNMVTSGYSSAIIGGGENTVDSFEGYSFIGGGQSNTQNGKSSGIVAGYNNSISGIVNYGFVGGGSNNTNEGSNSAIVGGSGNFIDNTNIPPTYNALYGAIVGGYLNTIQGANYAFIGGGYQNTVAGNYSVALGRNMNVTGINSVGIGLYNAGVARTLSQNNTLAIMDGRVGINTTTPAYKLVVQIDSATWGYVTALGGWQNASDARLKKNISDMTGSLEKVIQMRPIYYDPISYPDQSGQGKSVGFIAQEMENIIPEIVGTIDNTTTGLKGISYAQLTTVLAGAIKELNTKVENLINVTSTNNTIIYTESGLNIQNGIIMDVVAIQGKDDKWAIDENGQFITRTKTSDGNTKEMFAMQSPYSEFVFSSSSELVNGEAIINFDTSTCELIDETQPLKVNITLTGECGGIFVKEKTATGFMVKELGGGTSTSTFDWMVIAKRKIVTTTPEIITEPPVEAESFTEPSSGDGEPTTNPEVIPEPPVIEPTTTPESETTSTVEIVSKEPEISTSTPDLPPEPPIEESTSTP